MTGTYQDNDHEPEPFTAQPTPGSYYVQGFADGFHDRPQQNHRTKEAREAYSKGYNQGVQQRHQIAEKGTTTP